MRSATRTWMAGTLLVVILVGTFAATALAAGSGSRPERVDPHCGGKYGQFGMILILRQRDINCATVTKIAHELMRPHRGDIYDGLRCRRLNINAGGGAERCSAGRRLVEYGFE